MSFLTKTIQKLFTLFLVFSSTGILLAQTGTLRGVVIEEEIGEPLPFCNVVCKTADPVKGATTDLDGNYEMVLPVGKHTIEVTYVGLATLSVKDVEIVEGEVKSMDLLMKPSVDASIAEVVIEAKRPNNTEIAVLSRQKAALAISDGVSFQEFRRLGVNNAAESMRAITGASVVDGKNITVRGLGDRYTSAMLNNQILPSTDPYTNSPQLDLIPANMIDNIVASKTFTPDQPGSFTGGNVNIKTKEFPERYTMTAGMSFGYNEQSNQNANFLSYGGGKLDWLGYDDGTRQMPSIVQDPEVLAQMENSFPILARTKVEKAALLDQVVDGFNHEMTPTTKTSGLNHGVNFSVGNKFKVGNNPLGFLVGVNYRRNYKHYSEGYLQNWEIVDRSSDSLNLERDLRETRSVDNPVLGGLVNVAYKFAGTQKISFNALYNHDSENLASTAEGAFPAILSGSGVFQTHALYFRERAIQNYQLSGEHLLKADKGYRLDWGLGYVTSMQNEPDFRLFANHFDNGNYYITAAEYPVPYHFFRELNDQQTMGRADLTIPYSNEKSNKFKIGVSASFKQRTFVENAFQYNDRGRASQKYNGDPSVYFGEGNLGIIGEETPGGPFEVALALRNSKNRRNDYTGTENILAAYAMNVYQIGKLKTILGVRLETTDMEVVNIDTTGVIDVLDFLPAINLVYPLSKDMNLRLSATQTIARPNMREMAPFSSFEFIGDFVFSGSPGLDRTRIQNYDLRWEMFPGLSGDMFAASVYYKNFNNPIVYAFLSSASNPEVQPKNVENARVYGAEFEVRKSLQFVAPALQDFRIASNFSLIRSAVDIPADELEQIRDINPEKGSTRPFQGQSPFLWNAVLSYNNAEKGWDGSLSLNLFGDRLSSISQNARPDVYERGRARLDFMIEKRFHERYKVRFAARNLLNPAYRKSMDYKGSEFLIQSYNVGRTYSLNFSYAI